MRTPIAAEAEPRSPARAGLGAEERPVTHRLRREEVVTIQVLAEKQLPQRAIARQLGVTEGTVRYHLQRQRVGACDGRHERSFQAPRRLRPGWKGGRSQSARPTCTRCTSTSRKSTATPAATARCCATCGIATDGRRCGPTAVWRRRLGRSRRLIGASSLEWTWVTARSGCTPS